MLFASVDTDTVLSVCLDSADHVHSTSLFNISASFDNPLGVDETVTLQVDRKSDRVYLLRRRAASAPDDAGEVLVLRISLHCSLSADNSVFVQPQPISINVVAAIRKTGAYVF